LQNGVAIIKYVNGPTISALEIHHRRKNILSDIYIFIHLPHFLPSYINELLQRQGMSCFNEINKHPHHCTTDAGANFTFISQ